MLEAWTGPGERPRAPPLGEKREQTPGAHNHERRHKSGHANLASKAGPSPLQCPFSTQAKFSTGQSQSPLSLCKKALKKVVLRLDIIPPDIPHHGQFKSLPAPPPKRPFHASCAARAIPSTGHLPFRPENTRPADTRTRPRAPRPQKSTNQATQTFAFIAEPTQDELPKTTKGAKRAHRLANSCQNRCE